jgi:hypothetical protein
MRRLIEMSRGSSIAARLLSILILSNQFQAALLQAKESPIIGTFFNEGHSTVEVNVVSKDGRDTTVLTFSPGQIDRAIIEAGVIKVYTPAEKVSLRRLLSTRTTPTVGLEPEFFDQKARTFYFRVVDGKVTLIKPAQLTSEERRHFEAYLRQVRPR